MKSAGAPSRWESIICGLRGHATYAPDEEELASRLSVGTTRGDSWLCLRCGCFVPGPAAHSGPAEQAPLVLRGRALKDAVIMRLLAVDKGVRGLLLLLVAFGVWQFNGERDVIRRTVDTYLPLLAPLEDHLHIRLSDAAAMHWLQTALAAPATTVLMIAALVAGYGLLECVESVGLWVMRRWGEYVAAVGTSVFIPLEIHEVVVNPTWLRVAALVVNLFLIAYLVVTKRLFGVRGGVRAFEGERHEASLLELDQAAHRPNVET